jgi:ankyrin repeat protein
MSSIERFHEKNKHRDFTIRARLESLVNYLVLTASFFDDVTIIIDGLDECRPRDTLLAMIQKLAHSSIRVLVTSRADPDIKDRFIDSPNMEMDPGAMDEDVRKYIESRFKSERILSGLDSGLMDELKQELMAKHDGMCVALDSWLTFRFRWVECQLDTISHHSSPATRRAAIKKLPRGLDATYIRMLQMIEEKSEEYLEMACKAITWVIFARRLLTLEELTIAVSIAPGQEFTDDQKLDEKCLVEICSSFLNVNAQKRVSIAHFSVTEFFTTREFKRKKINPYFVDDLQGHSQLLQTSLTWLSSSPFCGGLCETKTEFKDRYRNQRFLYAAFYWQVHAKQCEESKNSQEEILSFLAGPAYEGWACFKTNREGVVYNWQDDPDQSWVTRWPVSRIRDTLSQAAVFGLTKTALELLHHRGMSTINTKSIKSGEYPLIAAIEGRNEDLVQALLDLGADPVVGENQFTALDRALFVGKKSITEALVRFQPSLGRSKTLHRVKWTSLFHDSRDDADLVKSLITNETITFEQFCGRNGLHEAVRSNKVLSAKVLIDNNVDINAVDDKLSTPLHYAARSWSPNDTAMIDLLVSQHGYLKARDNLGRTPLDVAVYSGTLRPFVKLLDLTYPQIEVGGPIKANRLSSVGILAYMDLEPCYRKLTEMEPSNPVYHEILGHALLGKGQIAQAQNEFDKTFALSAKAVQCLWKVKNPCPCYLCGEVRGMRYTCTCLDCHRRVRLGTRNWCSSCAERREYKCVPGGTQLTRIPREECVSSLRLTCGEIKAMDRFTINAHDCHSKD